MHEKTLNTREVFAGRIFRVEVTDVELEDGTRSVRDIVRHPGAAAVLARRGTDTFILVRQYRKPVEEESVEVVAGTLEAGEDPADCARREVEEEIAHRAGDLTLLGTIYPSPGYIDERIVIYLADVEPVENGASQDHDERVESVVLTRAEIRAHIRHNTIRDAKTLAVWAMFEQWEREHDGE